MPTPVVESLQASGGDHNSVAGFIAMLQATNFVTADEIRILECHDDWPNGLDERVSFVSLAETPTATNYVELRAAAGAENNGHIKQGFFFEITNAWSVAFIVGIPYLRLTDIEIAVSGSNTKVVDCQSGSSHLLIDRCISRSENTNAANISLKNTGNRIRSSLVVGGSDGINTLSLAQYGEIFQTGIINAATGFNGNTNADARNVFTYGCTNDYAGTFNAGSTNNATDKATAANVPGANSVVGLLPADFMDAANDNFHLSAGSALYGAGTDLSTDGVLLDIDRNSFFAPYPIGFDKGSAPGNPLDGSATGQAGASATLQSNMSVAGDAAGAASASGSLSTGIEVDADAAGQAVAGGSLTTDIPIASAAVTVALAGGTLTTGIPAEGHAAAQTSAAGGMAIFTDISGNAAAQTAAQGVLNTPVDLEGAAAAVVSAGGDLTVKIALAGASLAQALATGILDAAALLDGQASAESAGSGILTTQITLSGPALIDALAQANLTAPGSGFSADAKAAASASGGLITQIPLSGAANAFVAASADLATIIPLHSVAVIASNATGGLTTQISFNAQALAAALAQADIIVAPGLNADALAEALSGASLTTQIPLNGAALAQAAANGQLSDAIVILPKLDKYMVVGQRRRYTATARS